METKTVIRNGRGAILTVQVEKGTTSRQSARSRPLLSPRTSNFDSPEQEPGIEAIPQTKRERLVRSITRHDGSEVLSIHSEIT